MNELPSFEEQQGQIAKTQYNIRRIADTLHAVTESVEDETFGQGVVFTPWDVDDVTMEWFPDADVVRLQTGDMKVMFRKLGDPMVGEEQVIFSREDAQGKLSHFALTSKGEITVLQVPIGEDEEPRSLEVRV